LNFSENQVDLLRREGFDLKYRTDCRPLSVAEH